MVRPRKVTSKALVTTSVAPVTTSVALVSNSFLLLLVRHLSGFLWLAFCGRLTMQEANPEMMWGPHGRDSFWDEGGEQKLHK